MLAQGTECRWCGRTFAPRATGGHAQRFCRPACRRALDRAGRKFVAAAIADDGRLTVEALKSGYGATRALPAGAVSPPPIDPPRARVPEAPAKRSEDASLLDKLLSALLAMPPDELSWLIYYRLPGELGERLRDRMKPEKRAWFPSRSR